MKISIHQPCYFPWLGLLNKIKQADLFVVLDVVQFNKASYQKRTLVRSKTGKPVFLSVPVHYSMGTPLSDLQIANHLNWPTQHLRIIKECYAKAPYYDYYKEDVNALYLRKWEKLVDLCMATLIFECKALGINTPYILASQLSPAGRKNELNIDICRKTGADTYLSGAGSRDYLDMELFKNAGIKVVWQDFIHPQYPQKPDTGNFVSGMGGIDLIFNCGKDGGKYV